MLASKSAITKVQAAVIGAIIIVAVIASVVYYVTLPGPTPTEKRILRATFSWPTAIDPAVAHDFSSSRSVVNLYDPLLYPTPEGDVVPWVAETWEASEDGLTWTFYIRHGIKFHDGSELTAEDIAFSMNRLLTIGEGFASLFLPYVESATALDEYTVQIKLKRPLGPFLAMLPFLWIANKDLVMEHIKTPGPYGEYGDYGKEWLLTHDAGSGAYKVKEFILEEELIMERFEDYWEEVLPNAPDEVHHIGICEPSTVRTMMLKREVEITDQWQPEENLEFLDSVEGIDIASVLYGSQIQFSVHTRKPPTDDVHFRRAMAWAFDYEEALKLIPGVIRPKGVVPIGTPGQNPDVTQYHRDLEKAMEELQKSKYYDKLDEYTVEIHWSAAVPVEERISILFAECMEDIGISVKVVKTPWLTIIEEAASEEASPSMTLYYGNGITYNEAGSVFVDRFHSSSAKLCGTANWLLNSTIDAMIEDAIATTDLEERLKKYEKIEEILVDLCAEIPIADIPLRCVYQAYYVDWPATRGEVIPIWAMMYNFQHRLIQVDPEKRQELL